MCFYPFFSSLHFSSSPLLLIILRKKNVSPNFFSFSVRSLTLSQRVANDIFHVLFSNGKYHYLSLRNFVHDQIPSLLLCTTIHSLSLIDPIHVSDEMLTNINASLPIIASFSVRSLNQMRVIRQNGSTIANWQTAAPLGPPPYPKGVGPLPYPKGAPLGPPPYPKGAPPAPVAAAPPPPPAVPKQA
jgi:hypothetical protein